MTDYAEFPWATQAIDIRDLVIPNAVRLAVSSENIPFVNLLDCLRVVDESSREIVLLEVEVERPQHVHHAIERRERIAAVFTPGGDEIPEVLALRADFPQVPHLNLRTYEHPKSLCLYEESPREVMVRWTPLLFIERIRQWLNLTAKGELHQGDQPLEPLLLSNAGTIVLPDSAYEQLTSAENLPLFVSRVSRDSDPDYVLIARPADSGEKKDKPPFIAMRFICGQTIHGVIRRQPNTVLELATLVEDSGVDLIAQFRDRLKGWCQEAGLIERCLESYPILVMAFPKARTAGGDTEEVEVWAFVCDKKCIDVGVNLGVWSITGGKIGLHIELDKTKRGDTVRVLPLRPVRSFSRKAAATLSGLPVPNNLKIMLIGVGALGSHFFLNAVRAGLGQWTIVDNDRLLPHNLARHALDGRAVGCYKAECLSLLSNDMIDDKAVSVAIIADVLSPGEKERELATAMGDANVIVDASASLSVARYLALDIDSQARRVSTFFTPSGNASVFLVEDQERRSPLDILEMQYYREIAKSNHLKDHLTVSEQPLRYGQSCRDLTSRIPQDTVTLHAALSSGALKRTLGRPTAFGGIWTRDPDSQQVTFTSIRTYPLVDIGHGNWHIRTDEAFLIRLSDLRVGKLPNETGGVILGAHDMQRRIVYLVDTIPSPLDSEEWPTVYIRGCKGLAAEVQRTETRTGGNLTYIGEWHSHPDGASVVPSQDDMKAFNWLSSNMQSAGLPPLMIIVGQGGQTAIFIEVME